jgi:hypothetical protein
VFNASQIVTTGRRYGNTAGNFRTPLLTYRFGVFFRIHFHYTRFFTHMALAIERYGRLHLQFACADIAPDNGISPEIKQFRNMDFPTDFTQHICLLAFYIALYFAVLTNQDFGAAADIPDQGAVYAHITAADDIAFNGGTCANQAVAALNGCGCFGFGFCVEHDGGFL